MVKPLLFPDLNFCVLSPYLCHRVQKNLNVRDGNGLQDQKANTLPSRCKSGLLPQNSRSVFYTYPFYIFPCFKLIRPRIYLEPQCYSGTFRPDTRNTSHGSHTGHQMSQGAEKSQPPEVGIEPGPQDLQASTLPRRCKSGLLPQGCRSVFYTYPYYKGKCTEVIAGGYKENEWKWEPSGQR